MVNFPWGAPARLGLARAYAEQGNTIKARAAYQDFPTLWKDADPDVPILVDAKAEYAKLQVIRALPTMRMGLNFAGQRSRWHGPKWLVDFRGWRAKRPANLRA